MPAEQPPKSICEICGGTHPTAAHIDNVKNAQEAERGEEQEPNHEAMEKVVDLFVTEDLKYRDDPILPTLETGVPTPSTDFLYTDNPFGRIDATAKEKLHRHAELLEQARTGEDKDRRRQKSNVYYPEGILKGLHDKMLNTKTVELWSKDEMGLEANRYWPRILLSVLATEMSPEEIAGLEKIIGKSLDVILSKFKGSTKLEGGIEDKSHQVLVELLDNPEAFEIIRRAWLKSFFQEANAADTKTGRWNSSGYTEGWFIDGAYAPSYGLVLSPDVPVAVSPHPDYPTQATILSARVEPQQIIGLYVSDVKKTEMEETVFEEPKFPVEYLLHYFPRPFTLFLEKKGLDRKKLETYVEKFRDFSVRQPTGYYSLNMYRPNNETFMKDVGTGLSQFREALGDEDYTTLLSLAKEFIETTSPVKYNEPLWTGLMRRAEQYQLPVYNLPGDLLWPKQMSHGEVAKFVAEKPEKEK